jgi:hypothetical protein
MSPLELGESTDKTRLGSLQRIVLRPSFEHVRSKDIPAGEKYLAAAADLDGL